MHFKLKFTPIRINKIVIKSNINNIKIKQFLY